MYAYVLVSVEIGLEGDTQETPYFSTFSLYGRDSGYLSLRNLPLGRVVTRDICHVACLKTWLGQERKQDRGK